MNLITDRQTIWNDGPFPSKYDTVKVFEEGRKYYKHADESFATKSALRRTLSSEYDGAWIEEKAGKKRYFIDESGWFKRSIREVSKKEFAQKLETPSTWQKVLGIGLGVLALAPGVLEFARYIPKEAGLALISLQQKSPLLGAVGYSCFPSSADAQAMGTEFQVNTYTIGNQGDSSIVPLNNGGFVVTWTSPGQDGDGFGIYGQRYNANGARAGTEFQVNTYTTSEQMSASVAPLNVGGFVITWASLDQDGDGYGTYGQRYNATGVRAGNEFQVNTYTTSDQWFPSVAPLNDGGFVVTWMSRGQDGDLNGIYGQRYNTTGVRTGTEFQVNTYTTSHQSSPSIAPLNDGGFVITWESDGQDGDSNGIYGQKYDANGARAGTEFQVNTYTTSYQFSPSVAPLNDGGFIVTWVSFGQDGDREGIFGQRYDASGARAGTEFQVNTYTTNRQALPSVAPLNDGGFVVIWESYQGGNGYGIYGQSYDASGVRAGTEFLVNTFRGGDQRYPSVAPLNDGGFVVTWTSNFQDGSNDGIYGQRYDSNGNPVGLTVQIPSSGLPSQMSTSATQSSLTPSPSQVTSTSSPNLATSGPSLTSSAAITSELGTQPSPTSTQGLLSSAPSSTSETLTSGSMSPSASSMATSATSRPMPTTSGVLTFSNLEYGQIYYIYDNNEVVGTFSFSGGTGTLNANNQNILNFNLYSTYVPEEGNSLGLFILDQDEQTFLDNVELLGSDPECLVTEGQTSQVLGGATVYELNFANSFTCTEEPIPPSRPGSTGSLVFQGLATALVQ